MALIVKAFGQRPTARGAGQKRQKHWGNQGKPIAPVGSVFVIPALPENVVPDASPKLFEPPRCGPVVLAEQKC